MEKIIKFTKRYEVYSITLGKRFFEGSYNCLWIAKRMAAKKAKIHAHAIVVDTKHE